MADDLGVQCDYLLSALDESGVAPTQLEFSGITPSLRLRMPPQSLQISRNIRAEVLKDLGSGISIVTGGEGLGRITLHGTHGVGAFVDASTPSEGRVGREALLLFFSAFVASNDERGRTGKQGLRLVFRMVGGGFSNPENEAYLVWPDAFPQDSRSAARPHAWDWSLNLLLLAPWSLPITQDDSSTDSPQSLLGKVSALDKLLASAANAWRGVQSVLQGIRDVRSRLALIGARIKDFVAGVKDAIYQVTDLVRGTAQILTGILVSLSPTDFLNDATNAVRGACYETRRFLGQAAVTANQFKLTGAIQASLTGRRTLSPNRPAFVSLSVGDTLQGIAARVLGDSSRWTELVTANRLDFPYVDFSGDGGAPNSAYAGLRVLGATSPLKLPLPASPGVVGVADDPIGRDTPDTPTLLGDLQGGQENMIAALLRRLNTPRGRIPWHPSYGSSLPPMIGSTATLSSVMAARADVVDTLKTDPRVLGVSNVSASFGGDAITILADVITALGPLALSGVVAQPVIVER